MALTKMAVQQTTAITRMLFTVLRSSAAETEA
jgi:hypothetical protein